MSFLSLLPLRITQPVDFSPLQSIGCDVERLTLLRESTRLEQRATTTEDDGTNGYCDIVVDYPELLSRMGNLQEYHAALSQCLTQQASHQSLLSKKVTFSWKWKSTSSCINHYYVSSSHDWCGDWEWERRNILLNLLVLHAYQASTQLAPPLTSSSSSSSPASQQAINRGIACLQQAATLAHHIGTSCTEEDEEDGSDNGDRRTATVDLPRSYWTWLEQYLLGEAQRFTYVFFEKLNKPHFLLAKLSAACTALYQTAIDASMKFPSSLRTSDTRRSNPTERSILEDCQYAVRAWGMHFASVSEYHQALAHYEKKEYSASCTRLAIALRFATTCSNFCCESSCREVILVECNQQNWQVTSMIQEKLASLSSSENTIKGSKLDHKDLPPIDPQHAVKLVNSQMLSQLIPATLPDPPLFAPIVSSLQRNSSTLPSVQSETINGQIVLDHKSKEGESSGKSLPCRNKQQSQSQLQQQIQQQQRQSLPRSPIKHPPYPSQQISDWKEEHLAMVEDLALWVKSKADSARHALAIVGLPHTLDAYQQQLRGGGIPTDLWTRVEAVQQTNRDETLKSQMWQLRDVADRAMHIYQCIVNRLQEDLQMDQSFRRQHADFVGRNVGQDQIHFRRVLDEYSRLMSSAQDSDAVLSAKLQILETDPKFFLLKFRKEQLDNLIPASAAKIQNDSNNEIDVRELSQALTTLSERLIERDNQVDALINFIGNIAAGSSVEREVNGGSDSINVGKGELEAASQHARDELKSIRAEVLEQNSLVHRILKRHEIFIQARNETEVSTASAESSSNILEKLNDALDELDKFTSHLNDGTAFYNLIIPKLEKLQQNVGDVSVRFTIERCEYEENVRRNCQQEEDARVAEEMMSDSRQLQPSENVDQLSPSSFIPSSKQASSQQWHQEQQHQEQVPSHCNAPSMRVLPSSSPDPEHLSLPANNLSPVIPPSSDRSRTTPRLHSHQRVDQVSPAHDDVDVPPALVDDAKVAGLIELGFDPDRAVVALRRYDNNMDLAINDLLG